MSKDFVKEIYKTISPVVINWVDFHANYDEIIEYSSKRYRVIEGFNSPIDDYNVRIELKNGYNIGIAIVTSGSREKYKTTKILQVYATGPGVTKDDRGNGCIDTYPARVMKERIMFVDGEFDIDSAEFISDILKFLNKYAEMEKAEVEVVE
nr:MAG TPA: GatD-like protein [Caudoviricetes sp.]